MLTGMNVIDRIDEAMRRRPEPTRPQECVLDGLAARYVAVQVIDTPSEANGPVTAYCLAPGHLAYPDPQTGSHDSRGLVCKAVCVIDADGKQHWR